MIEINGFLFFLMVFAALGLGCSFGSLVEIRRALKIIKNWEASFNSNSKAFIDVINLSKELSDIMITSNKEFIESFSDKTIMINKKIMIDLYKGNSEYLERMVKVVLLGAVERMGEFKKNEDIVEGEDL